MYKVLIKRKVLRQIQRIPKHAQQKFRNLVEDLETNGPMQPTWPNFSKLDSNQYHCHLTYHWVACWSYTKNTVTIEVYYVGSRENAPY